MTRIHFDFPEAVARQVARALVPALLLCAAPALAQDGGGSTRTDPVTGAAVGDSGPRIRAHTVAQTPSRAASRHELSLTVPVQVNSRFTHHLGTGLDYAYHLSETFAVTAGGTWYARGVLSGFTEGELQGKARQQPFAADMMLLQWDARAGVELTPIYGKMSLFSSRVLHFGFFVGSGLGVAQTRVQLRTPDPGGAHGRTFGDTGLRPVGVLNAGMRVFLGQMAALKLEVRDVVYSDAVHQINGCTRTQIEDPTSSCAQSFVQGDRNDTSLALDLLKDPSSSVLHNLSFVGSFSVLF